jgi:hypothetical protein
MKPRSAIKYGLHSIKPRFPTSSLKKKFVNNSILQNMRPVRVTKKREEAFFHSRIF